MESINAIQGFPEFELSGPYFEIKVISFLNRIDFLNQLHGLHKSFYKKRPMRNPTLIWSYRKNLRNSSAGEYHLRNYVSLL